LILVVIVAALAFEYINGFHAAIIHLQPRSHEECVLVNGDAPRHQNCWFLRLRLTHSPSCDILLHIKRCGMEKFRKT
jgi:hypothetical protein